jgi:hypothetical protein
MARIGDPSRLFAEIPDDLDETWRHGFLVGGMAHHTSEWELAKAYKLAGDIVIETARSRPWAQGYEIGYPALYLYRHAIELYLKAVVPTKGRPTHDLVKLVTRFAGRVSAQLGQRVPDWYLNYLLEFAAIDRGATAFRFADERAREQVIAQNEGWVEFARLRDVMDRLAGGFENVLRALA